MQIQIQTFSSQKWTPTAISAVHSLTLFWRQLVPFRSVPSRRSLSCCLASPDRITKQGGEKEREQRWWNKEEHWFSSGEIVVDGFSSAGRTDERADEIKLALNCGASSVFNLQSWPSTKNCSCFLSVSFFFRHPKERFGVFFSFPFSLIGVIIACVPSKEEEGENGQLRRESEITLGKTLSKTAPTTV